MSHRDSGNIQHQAEHTRSRRPTVLSYLVILFAVAFLLLLMAYFQQQRLNSETNDALKQSVSAVGTIENMMSDNEVLRQEVESLKNDYQELKELYLSESKAHGEFEAQAIALDYLWRIQRYWDRGNPEEALVLVEHLEQSGYAAALPTSPLLNTEGPSPMEQYNALLDALDYREEP